MCVAENWIFLIHSAKATQIVDCLTNIEGFVMLGVILCSCCNFAFFVTIYPFLSLLDIPQKETFVVLCTETRDFHASQWANIVLFSL